MNFGIKFLYLVCQFFSVFSAVNKFFYELFRLHTIFYKMRILQCEIVYKTAKSNRFLNMVVTFSQDIQWFEQEQSSDFHVASSLYGVCLDQYLPGLLWPILPKHNTDIHSD